MTEQTNGLKRRLRAIDIVGNPYADPPIPAPLFPVSPANWWKGVEDGRYPPGRKDGPNIRTWGEDEIRHLLEHGPAQPNPEIVERRRQRRAQARGG